MDNSESIKQQMSDDEKWDALQAEAEAELERVPFFVVAHLLFN